MVERNGLNKPAFVRSILYQELTQTANDNATSVRHCVPAGRYRALPTSAIWKFRWWTSCCVCFWIRGFHSRCVLIPLGGRVNSGATAISDLKGLFPFADLHFLLFGLICCHFFVPIISAESKAALLCFGSLIIVQAFQPEASGRSFKEQVEHGVWISPDVLDRFGNTLRCRACRRRRLQSPSLL